MSQSIVCRTRVCASGSRHFYRSTSGGGGVARLLLSGRRNSLGCCTQWRDCESERRMTIPIGYNDGLRVIKAGRPVGGGLCCWCDTLSLSWKTRGSFSISLSLSLVAPGPIPSFSLPPFSYLLSLSPRRSMTRCTLRGRAIPHHHIKRGNLLCAFLRLSDSCDLLLMIAMIAPSCSPPRPQLVPS